MAYEIIGTYPVYEWEQEEIIEDKVLKQDYVKLVAELQVKQNRDISNNISTIRGELWVHCTAGANGNDVYFTLSGATNKLQHYPNIIDTSEENDIYDAVRGLEITVEPGKTVSKMIRAFTSSSNYLYEDGNTNYASVIFECVHNLDGTMDKILRRWHKGYHGIGTRLSSLLFLVDFQCNVKSRTLVYDEVIDNYNKACTASQRITYSPLSINRALIPVTADNFNDESAAIMKYSAQPGRSTAYDNTNNNLYGVEDFIIECQAAISFDGVNADIAWRDIPLNNSIYVFLFTDAERELLRTKAQGSTNVSIYYLTRIVRQAGGGTLNGKEIITQMPIEFRNATQRTLTIITDKPTLNPTVRDVNSSTLELTGNENIFVRYESMAEFSTGATASKNATITSQSVQCGSKIVKDLYNGVIDNVEDNQFVFDATDSRGLHADRVVIGTTMINYVKPTVKIDLEARLTAETEVTIDVTFSGNYFNGNFGIVDNNLTIYLRYAEGYNELGIYKAVSGQPVFNEEDNTYELKTTLTGLNYASSYTFQARIMDLMHDVITSEQTIRLMPVFDWSETDFNFNVPLQMNGSTVLRHNKTANNTVLSASGGHIYLRPGGTDDTDGQSIIYPDGTVEFGGVVNFDSSIQINGNIVTDYVIDSGSESMGSNGTWKWQKWASGKAECWGCRNFGNMAVSTAWGNLYRGAILTQDLPEDLFARTPDSININIVHGNYGGWIVKHENTAPSAITTGSFIYVRPASATVSPTNIGFYVIGEWK